MNWYSPRLIAGTAFSAQLDIEGSPRLADGIWDASASLRLADGAFAQPTEEIAIDAIHMRRGTTAHEQLGEALLLREVAKAYAGFSGGDTRGIATGNWARPAEQPRPSRPSSTPSTSR